MSIKSTKVSREKVDWLLQQPIDVKLSIAQQHLDLCKIIINSLLETDVKQLCGERYSRDKPHEGRYDRWGYNPGSVKLGDQKLKVDIPRVYDNDQGSNLSLPMYDKLKELPEQGEEVMQSVLHGISMRDYEKVATCLTDSFGLSASTTSRQFIEYSRQAVEQFCTRRFDDLDMVALFIDGKHLSGQQMIIAMAVTIQGRKVPLSVIQASSENSKVIAEMLSDLIARGLKFDHGLLCVIDGSKGIRKAVEQTFGDKALIQRCQWHKRENVVSYLNKEQEKNYRSKLQRAYRNQIYKEARAELQSIIEELRPINIKAAQSLEEGLEETLTLQRHGLLRNFGCSFSTTNCIENLNAQLCKYVGKVKRWVDSEQRYRWTICGLIEIEKRMGKVKQYAQLHELAETIHAIIKKENLT